MAADLSSVLIPFFQPDFLFILFYVKSTGSLGSDDGKASFIQATCPNLLTSHLKRLYITDIPSFFSYSFPTGSSRLTFLCLEFSFGNYTMGLWVLTSGFTSFPRIFFIYIRS